MRSYPTDEELEQLIEEIEKVPLYAPAYLKDEILKSLEKQDLISLQKRRHNQIAMFTYSVKVFAGMAAALFLVLFLPKIPLERNWEVPEQYRFSLIREESSLERGIRNGVRTFQNMTGTVFENIRAIDNLFDQED